MPDFAPEEFVYSQTAPSVKNKSSLWKYMFLFVLIGMCIGLGYVLSKVLPTQTIFLSNEPNTVAKENPIVLPSDAIQLIQCLPLKGSIYVIPSDLPAGPLYMVYHGQVIGIEFLMDKNTIGNSNMYGSISSLNFSMNHVNFGLLPKGYGDNKKPYYFLDFYFVSKDTEQTIGCEKQ